MAMGPFRMADLAGLDVGMACASAAPRSIPRAGLRQRRGPSGARPGASGRRPARAGTATSPARATPIPDPQVAAIIEKFRAARGYHAAPVSDGEIVERCIYALVNEGARIVEEGIAQRSSDIDIVYLNGYGFPAYRGGPMFYADQVGLAEVARALRAHRRHGRRARPPPGSRRRCWRAWPGRAGPSASTAGATS